MITKRISARTGLLTRGVSVGLVLLLVACGGGGSGSSTPPSAPPSQTAPSGLTYPGTLVFTVSQTIMPVSPTVTGTVTSYSVGSQLPAGVVLDPTSGVISGTPTAIAAQASYTVKASNSTGSTTASVSITVNDVKPAFSYSSANLAMATGVAIQKLTPATTGGSATSWSASPNLPAGLALNTADGSITGTPTAGTPQAQYTVTASNSGGQTSVALTITVQSGTLVDLGHTASIGVLRFDGTHVLSEDGNGHWVLWTYSTGVNVASGDSGCINGNNCYLNVPPCTANVCSPRSDFAGSTIAIATPSGFEIRAVADGHLLGTITTSAAWWRLASDGSYLCAGGPSGLTVWSTTGQTLFTRTGNYSPAQAFAAPGEVRIAGGPAGANVVETVAVPTGASTVNSASFQGMFRTWSTDGERFLSTTSDTSVLTYSKAVVQQDVTTLSAPSQFSLGAAGNWFWDFSNGVLYIYKIGASTSPAATYSVGLLYSVIPSGTALGVIATTGPVVVVDLSGSTPAMVSQTLPVTGASGFAATSASAWLVGNNDGVLLDGVNVATTPRYFDYGNAWSIAGSSTRAVIATASGRILSFNVASKMLEGTISKFSGKVLLSADGTVLAALGDPSNTAGRDASLKIYSMPAQTVLESWAYDYSTPPYPVDISLDGAGALLGQVFSIDSNTGTYLRQVTPATGGAPVWTNTSNGPTTSYLQPIRLSADGTLIAAPVGQSLFSAGTNIYNNGTLSTSVSGWAVGWLDNARLLVNTYGPGLQPFKGAVIVNTSGTQLATTALPQLVGVQPVDANTFYSPELLEILASADASVTWQAPYPALLTESPYSTLVATGAVAGSSVVFATGTNVLALPH